MRLPSFVSIWLIPLPMNLRCPSPHAFALLGALALTGCHITIDASDDEWVWYSEDQVSFSELPRHEFDTELDGSGRSSSFTLTFGEQGDPSLVRVDKVTESIAYLGVETESLDSKLARSLDVEAWSGVRVTQVLPGTPAEGAGLLAGDLLHDLNDLPITSSAQLSDLVVNQLEPNVPGNLGISRFTANDGRVKRDLEVTLGKRSETRSDSQTVELASLPEIEASTGIQLAEIPEDWSAKFFGGDPARILVSGVWIGSPAYLAGIRTGDQIESWNGARVTSLEEIEAAASAVTAEHVIEVFGAPGSHTAAVGPSNLERRRSFHIPILTKYKQTIQRKRVSFLNFIFQFGFNYRRDYLATESREPARNTELSILPLGMFEFERSPTRSRNRIFWLITWGSDDD